MRELVNRDEPPELWGEDKEPFSVGECAVE